MGSRRRNADCIGALAVAATWIRDNDRLLHFAWRGLILTDARLNPNTIQYYSVCVRACNKDALQPKSREVARNRRGLAIYPSANTCRVALLHECHYSTAGCIVTGHLGYDVRRPYIRLFCGRDRGYSRIAPLSRVKHWNHAPDPRIMEPRSARCHQPSGWGGGGRERSFISHVPIAPVNRHDASVGDRQIAHFDPFDSNPTLNIVALAYTYSHYADRCVRFTYVLIIAGPSSALEPENSNDDSCLLMKWLRFWGCPEVVTCELKSPTLAQPYWPSNNNNFFKDLLFWLYCL